VQVKQTYLTTQLLLVFTRLEVQMFGFPQVSAGHPSSSLAPRQPQERVGEDGAGGAPAGSKKPDFSAWFTSTRTYREFSPDASQYRTLLK